MLVRNLCGELYLFWGCMFFTCANRNVEMIKSSKDTRYAIDAVVTHDGTKFPCWSLPDLSSFKQRFGEDAYENVQIKDLLYLTIQQALKLT